MDTHSQVFDESASNTRQHFLLIEVAILFKGHFVAHGKATDFL